MSRQPVVFSRNSRGRLFGENRVRTFSVGTCLPRAGLFITTWHYWTRVLVNKHATCFSAGTLSNFGHDARLVMAPSTVCRRRSVPVGVWLRTVFGHEEAESQGSQACKPWGSSPFGGEKETEVGDPNFVLSFFMLTYSPSNPDCHVLELGTGQLGKKMWKTRMLKCEGIFSTSHHWLEQTMAWKFDVLERDNRVRLAHNRHGNAKRTHLLYPIFGFLQPANGVKKS